MFRENLALLEAASKHCLLRMPYRDRRTGRDRTAAGDEVRPAGVRLQFGLGEGKIKTNSNCLAVI